ncbi:HEAT repeat domain-containing protein, partial [bacterium]|nr:HEAT repeat domain-containing protein [bacterium]
MKAIETQRLSLCVLDKSPKTNGIYREIFASDRMNVEFYTEPEPALSYIRSKEMDLCIGALEIGDRFLLEFIQAAKRPGHNAAVLMIHPRYCAEDVAFFRACGVHVAIPSDTTPLAYRQAILGGINALFGHEVSTNHPSNRERPKSNLSMPDALELAFDDIVDKRGTLVGLPDASESDIAADVNMMSEAAMRIDSENGLISFAESVEKIGKPRAVAALLRLAEKKSNPEQSLWFVQLIALIPSYPTRLALQRLAKTHPSAGPRNLAAKEGKILLQTHPVLFHAERLLAENAAQSRASAIAVALVKSDSNLAFGILTRALVRHCPAIQRACIKGLGHVATGDALEMVCKRLKMFRLARETAFFKDAYEPRQHLLYLESLAAILKATAQSHPEIAEDMAADLASDDLRIRCKAIEIVGLSEKTTCCRRLAGAFAAQDWRVRLAALEAIGGSSDPDCGHELQRFLGDANHIVRQKALQILEQMNMKDGLREVLRTDDHVAKAAAAAALGRMIDDKSIPELIALALNEKHAVAHEALKSLSRIADPDSVRDLQALLDRSDDPELYADATYCIGRVGTEYALDVLMQYARKNCKAPDFRLPLLIRAVGAALDVMAWRVSPQ